MIRKYILLILTIVSVTISGCKAETFSQASNEKNHLDVDLRFREFYDWLGGEAVLGPVISTKFESEGLEYQYTAAALLVYLPNATNNQRYQLAPLGLEIGLAEPPQNPGSSESHEIYPIFLELYNQIGGVRYAGDPITEPHYNAEKGRIEQHFENIGFYHLDTNKNDVHLLHYGAWKCGDGCSFIPPERSEVIVYSAVDSSFEAAILKLDPSFTGYPLTKPYHSSDGLLEQIFENVVIVADVDAPSIVRLRPILGMIGIPVQEPDDYYVPDHFLEYINLNSGLEFCGPPLTDYVALSSEVFRQCFSSICLDYFPNAPQGFDVRPAPLGYTYKSLFFNAASQNIEGDNIGEMAIRVWETYPLVKNYKNQEIGVMLESGSDPLENYEPLLTLIIPGFEEKNYKFPPTNQDGTSYLVLDPINAENGTRIEYKVCVDDLELDKYCIEDDFMIWGE
jgi:hypothetical protein